MQTSRFLSPFLLLPIFLLAFVQDSSARPPIRKAFFNVYTSAEGSRLDDLPSNSGHCGVCHFDFNGGGPRNPYGLAVEVARGSMLYSTDEEAIQSVENLDSDSDGYSSLIEITDTANFSNTPTFPGLFTNNVSQVSNVDLNDIDGYLTPSGGSDTTPPTVTVLSPNGAESFNAESVQSITWTASDASGISHVDIYMSDDNGSSFKFIAKNEANDGTFSWFVPNLPGTQSLVKVRARDNAGNYGSDNSDASFTIIATPPGAGGVVATTLRDFDMPGTQPFEGAVLGDPDVECTTCHGNYNISTEPWYAWKGSMMSQAARDPLFYATLVVAQQDAPSVGDMCIRCHTPGGWQEGRSTDTGGGMLTAKDRQGVQCDFCHRSVDPVYKAGISPPEDIAVLDSLDALPPAYANGMFVTDPNPLKRGPYSDAQASHQFLESPFHRESDICGTCHDVSNPVFIETGPGEYSPNDFDAPHPDMDLRNMFPVERTYSEWSQSEYAVLGVYAPLFAGNKPDGIVSTCQDCHQPDASGKGCSEPGAPTRSDLPLHLLNGGNTFVPDILPSYYPSEVDSARLYAGKLQAMSMLHRAATMELSVGSYGSHPVLTVKITNETGHKLPSGYPEGRRMWINVKAYDDAMVKLYESGEYDFATGTLIPDADEKIYHIEPGISTRLASTVGVTSGPSFHFVLNDSVYLDNRIPPRGFTNANFEAVQSPPVGYTYPDDQYWDETEYTLPEEATHAEVILYYQTTSKEYIEFLRDENETDNQGQDLYDAWVQQGRGAPVVMVSDAINLNPTAAEETPKFRNELFQNVPNPFNPSTLIKYSLRNPGRVSIKIYDVRGKLVKTLVDEEKPEGLYRVTWNGRNERGQNVSSGIYFYKMISSDFQAVRKLVLLK